jgi:dynein heavy chain
VKATDNYLKVMQSAIQFGTPCLLENVGEDLDPTLEPLLLKQSYTKGTTKVIKFGDADIEFNDSFKLFMTTKLRNPHYLPEVATKVVLLNFMITLEGLEDQLLGRVVNQEEPDLEAKRQELVDQSAAHMASLKGLEDKILAVLEASKGIILDDEAAIDVLHQSKELSVDLERKQQKAMLNEEQIDKVRKGYQPVAFHASALFFCIGDLVHIDPMYQFSLEWFITLFEQGKLLPLPIHHFYGHNTVSSVQ